VLSQQIVQFLQDFAPAILFIGLLFGPTLLFFVLRAFWGSTGGRRQGHLGLVDPADTVPLEQLIDSGQYWVCERCRGLNMDFAVRCYRCGTERPVFEPEPVPATAPAAATAASPGKPVLQPSTVDAPLRPAVPVMAAAAAADREPVAVPIEANGRNGVHEVNGVAGVNGTNGKRPPVEPRPWCPLLGVRDNPRTVYSFPHLDHRCHATSKLSPIDAVQQATYCLTGEYPNCLAYRSLAARLGGTGAEEPVPAGGQR